MRSMAQELYSALRSQPNQTRWSCSATTAVVPEPEKGSSTTSPTLLAARTSFRSSSSGFWVGCLVFSPMPLQVVGISKTSLGLAPRGLGTQTEEAFFPLEYRLLSAWGWTGYFKVCSP